MEIYLRHPVHGTKIATMDLEANYDEQHGWVRYTPATPSPVEEAAPVEVNAMIAPQPEVKRRRKSVVVPEGE